MFDSKQVWIVMLTFIAKNTKRSQYYTETCYKSTGLLVSYYDHKPKKYVKFMSKATNCIQWNEIIDTDIIKDKS